MPDAGLEVDLQYPVSHAGLSQYYLTPILSPNLSMTPMTIQCSLKGDCHSLCLFVSPLFRIIYLDHVPLQDLAGALVESGMSHRWLKFVCLDGRAKWPPQEPRDDERFILRQVFNLTSSCLGLALLCSKGASFIFVGEVALSERYHM